LLWTGHEFKENGGEEFLAIPCLNDGDDWCNGRKLDHKWSNVSAIKVDAEK
jgi:ferrochelatase